MLDLCLQLGLQAAQACGLLFEQRGRLARRMLELVVELHQVPLEPEHDLLHLSLQIGLDAAARGLISRLELLDPHAKEGRHLACQIKEQVG